MTKKRIEEVMAKISFGSLVAGEICDKLQKEVNKGFSKVSKDVNKLEARMEKALEDIHEELNIVYNEPDKDE